MVSLSKKTWIILCFMPLSLFIMQCNKKKGTFEVILEEYIDYYKLNAKEHYIKVSTNKWSDTTCLLYISYAYVNIDKLLLPEVTFKSSYNGITMYCSNNIDSLSLSHNLSFEKIITRQVPMELEAHNEYFNDVQIVCCLKGDCLIGIMAENKSKEKEINHFNNFFTKKGLVCHECYK